MKKGYERSVGCQESFARGYGGGRYLGVSEVVVYRWCREGRLPCLKVGRVWRIHCEVLEGFLRQGERPRTLLGQLRSFLDMPDNVLAVVQNRALLHNLDAAFFRIGEARGGMLVKYCHEGSEPEDELRAEFEIRDLEVTRLEEEGYFRFIAESGLPGARRSYGGLASRKSVTAAPSGPTSTEETSDLDAVLGHQQEIAELVEDSSFVVMTCVLESELDEWPGAAQRQAQVLHARMIWLSEAGVTLGRALPPPTA